MDRTESIECEDSGDSTIQFLPFSLKIDDCSSEGDYGLGSLCCGIILILLGIGVGISAFVSLLTGQLVVIKK